MQKQPARMGGLRERMAPYLFLSPFLISYLVFFLYPAGFSLMLSFTRYKGYGDMRFVGLENFAKLLQYETMWRCLGNTFLYFIASFVPVMIISFLLAVMVRSRSVRRFQSFYKPLIFLPQICAVVASALVFKVIFGNQVGVINQLFGSDFQFLNDMNLMKWPIIALMVWRQTGWYFIIFLSGLTTISDEITEASTIDGATAFQNLIHITIPMMKPIFMLAFVTYGIGSLKLFTEPNLVLSTTEAPLQVAPFLNIVTTNITGGVFGMASAAGWFLVLIILALTLIQLRLFREEA
jgi:ABC-type sugar transport system permease subunit